MSDDFDPFSEAPAASGSQPTNTLPSLDGGNNEVTGDDLFEAPVGGASSTSSVSASNAIFGGGGAALSAPVAHSSSSSSSAFDAAPAADDALVYDDINYQRTKNDFFLVL